MTVGKDRRKGPLLNTHPRHRRKTKIRRTGRHTAPSAVEKVAQSAGKAAPAVAVVGALAATPQVHNLVSHHPAVAARRVIQTRAEVSGVLHRRGVRHTPGRSYVVRSGDTLSAIAGRYYGQPGDWRWLYHVNRAEIADPNLIFPGEKLRVPQDPPASFTALSTPSRRGPVIAEPTGRHHAGSRHRPRHARTELAASSTLEGTLDCGGLEQLWLAAGGSPQAELTAASVAMAESGGDQFAHSPTDDIGYWQINAPSWGALASTDPMTNARAAVQISSDGTNWSPWTTYTSGAYAGRC